MLCYVRISYICIFGSSTKKSAKLSQLYEKPKVFSFLSFVGIPFPTPLKSIPKVEEQNDLSINVFGYEEVIYPLYLSSRDDASINLLLVSAVVHGQTVNHYVWIKNMSRLLHDQNKHANRKHFCLRCLCSFNTEASLAKHTLDCKRVADGEPARVTMPEDPMLKFMNVSRRMKIPYIIYADSEAIISPIEHDGGQKTTRESKHILCSIGFIVVRSDGKKTREFFYRGADCVEKFYRELQDVSLLFPEFRLSLITDV